MVRQIMGRERAISYNQRIRPNEGCGLVCRKESMLCKWSGRGEEKVSVEERWDVVGGS